MSEQLTREWQRMLCRSFHPSQWWDLDDDRQQEPLEDIPMWVYRQTENNHGVGCYTVGFYDPKGQWHTDGDFGSKREAAHRVNFLNGGNK